MKAKMQSLKAKVVMNRDRGLSTLIKVYYTGHGIMRSTTFCATCSSTSRQQYYPLENFLKTISTYDKTFVFGIFDCCRNEVKEK